MNSLLASLRVVFWSTLMTLGPAASISAQRTSGCFDAAAGIIATDETITVVRNDGGRTTGRLLSVSPSQSILTLYLMDAGMFTSVTVNESDIAQVRYYRRGKIRPALALLGVAVGILAGMIIEESLTSPGHIELEPFNERGLWHGDRIGAAGGFAAGLMVSMFLPSARKIPCGTGE